MSEEEEEEEEGNIPQSKANQFSQQHIHYFFFLLSFLSSFLCESNKTVKIE